MAGYHATWADGNEDEIVAEASHLPRVFEAMAQAAPTEEDLPVIGDSNLVPEIVADAVATVDRTYRSGIHAEQPGQAPREPLRPPSAC